jgi:hypothetical protein
MALENLVAGELTIEVVEGEGRGPIQLTWRGKSQDRNPGRLLAPYFATVLTAAARRLAPVEMHFESLESFNSSTITSIIQVIQNARVQGVKLVMTFNGSLKWQRFASDALRVFVKADNLLELRSV